MNKLEIIKKMKHFYANDQKIQKFFKKNNIEKIQNIIFREFLISDHKIYGKIGISFDSFNELSIKFISFSILNYLEKNIENNYDKFNIFISYDGTPEIEKFYKLIAQIFSESKFKIILIKENEPTNLSYIQFINQYLKFHLIINLTKTNKTTDYYQLELLDNSFHNISNEIIDKMISYENLDFAFNNLSNRILYLNTNNIFFIEKDYQRQEFIKHLSLIKQTIVYKENAKILIVNSFENNQKYTNDIFNSLLKNSINLDLKQPKKNILNFIKKNKITKANYSKIQKVAKKNKVDLIFVKNNNNIQDEIMIKNNKKYWILNYEQITILIIDYLLKFIDPNDRKNYFVATNYNNLDTVEKMCIKNKIKLVENMNFIDQRNFYSEKLLLYFDKDYNFFFNDEIITRPNSFQLEIILYEIINYYKNQKRNINFVFNKIIKTYVSQVLFINKIKHSQQKINQNIKNLVDNKKIYKDKIIHYEYFNNLKDFSADKYFIKIFTEKAKIILYYSKIYDCTYVNINADILNKRYIFFKRKNYSDFLFEYVKNRIKKGKTNEFSIYKTKKQKSNDISE